MSTIHLMDIPSTTHYMRSKNGDMFIVSDPQFHLLMLLKKFGLKTIPTDMMYSVTITGSTGVVSVNVSGWSANTIYISPPHPFSVSSSVIVPEPEEPKVKKRPFSKFEKKAWRDKWSHHSRSTGR